MTNDLTFVQELSMAGSIFAGVVMYALLIAALVFAIIIAFGND